jgi:formylglycine-generating enzyme required for sulfatase activity
VAVSDFCIDSTEVTQSQYHAWLAGSPSTAGQAPECAWNTDFAPPSACTLDSLVCQWAGGQCGTNPQVCVDWCDAQAYCKAMGKRLCGARSGGPATYGDPSTGEWRTACGGVYPYGSTYQAHVCNDQGMSVAGEAPVGSLPGCVVTYGDAGVYDLSGNVAEWEDSCSGQTGATDTCRTRGGSFRDTAAALTCDAVPTPPLQRQAVSASVGFRCCS